MRWRGYLIIPIFLSIVLVLLGQNQIVRLSDPLDFLSTGLGLVLAITQIIIWVSWFRNMLKAK
jgi:hypothetical protein